MTSIAFDGRYLACDSQVTSGGAKMHTHKFREVSTSSGPAVVVVTGEFYALDEAAAAVIAGEEDIPVPEDTCIGVLRKGSLTWYTEGGTGIRVRGTDAAGSGAQAVLAGLHLGLRADQAVALACAVDLYSSGTVWCWDSKTLKRVRTKVLPRTQA